MRLTIVTVGSRGDVQPFVALGVGLRDAGHAVRIAAPRPFADLVAAHGLDFAPLAGDPRALLETEAGRSWLDSGGNGLAFARRFVRLLGGNLEAGLDDTFAACRGTDAVLGAVFAFGAESAAQKLGVPYGRLLLQPFDRTRAFQTVGVPRSFGPWHDLATHLVAEQVLWQPVRRQLNRWRVGRLGLPPLPLLGPALVPPERRPPTVYGFSPLVVPPPPDWGPRVTVAGYWPLGPEPGWSPPPALEAFLADGEPPVSVGFGSMTARDPAALLRTTLDALRAAGRRGVLLAGWSGLGVRAEDFPADVFLADEVPHAWLFPRCAAAVHHGGAGTTAASLRAGVPTVVVPFFADQPFWGRRVHALGVGPRPVPFRRLEAVGLAEALRGADDPDLRARASALGARLRAEDGVGRGVAAIERWMGMPSDAGLVGVGERPGQAAIGPATSGPDGGEG